MTLKQPVYTPKKDTEVFKLNQQSTELKDKFYDKLDAFIGQYPELDSMGIFSSSKVGYPADGEYVHLYDKELKVGIESGYRIFKKNSKTLKLIQNSIGDEYDEYNSVKNNVRFRMMDYFPSVSRRFSSQTIDGILYFSTGEDADDNDDILLVEYSDYLRILADKMEKSDE